MLHLDDRSPQARLRGISFCALLERCKNAANPVKIRVFRQCLLQNISGFCYDLEAHEKPPGPRQRSEGTYRPLTSPEDDFHE